MLKKRIRPAVAASAILVILSVSVRLGRAELFRDHGV